MNYVEHGEGRPLVALHGWTLDHRAQEASLEPLFARRPGWRRIYPDLPGHGRTAAPEWARTHEDMCEALIAFVDAVTPDECICAAGLSYGAALVQMLVERRCARIGGVLLTAPPTDDPSLPEFAVRRSDERFVAALAPEEEHQLDFVVWQSPEVLREIRQRFDTAAALCDRDFLERLGWGGHLQQLAEPFQGPALIVTGRFDQWCGYRRMFELLDDYPLATYAVLDGAGHGLTIEREALYHALVNDWLNRVEAV